MPAGSAHEQVQKYTSRMYASEHLKLFLLACMSTEADRIFLPVS
jgi:hypothetical protein